MEFNIILDEIRIIENFIFKIIRIVNDSSAFSRTKFVFRKNSELNEAQRDFFTQFSQSARIFYFTFFMSEKDIC
jgi:hypothetical protein